MCILKITQWKLCFSQTTYLDTNCVHFGCLKKIPRVTNDNVDYSLFIHPAGEWLCNKHCDWLLLCVVDKEADRQEGVAPWTTWFTPGGKSTTDGHEKVNQVFSAKAKFTLFAIMFTLN